MNKTKSFSGGSSLLMAMIYIIHLINNLVIWDYTSSTHIQYHLRNRRITKKLTPNNTNIIRAFAARQFIAYTSTLKSRQKKDVKGYLAHCFYLNIFQNDKRKVSLIRIKDVLKKRNAEIQFINILKTYISKVSKEDCQNLNCQNADNLIIFLEQPADYTQAQIKKFNQKYTNNKSEISWKQLILRILLDNQKEIQELKKLLQKKGNFECMIKQIMAIFEYFGFLIVSKLQQLPLLKIKSPLVLTLTFAILLNNLPQERKDF